MHILPIIYRYLFFSLVVLLIGSCQEDEALEEPSIDCSMRGSLNDSEWCGQIFEIFLDDQGSMVVNASRPSTQENVDIEQITVYIPDFDGEGSYQLANEGAVYREWFASDMLFTCAKSEEKDDNQVVVESYDQASGEIRGTVTFLAETSDSLYRFEQGTFEGVVRP